MPLFKKQTIHTLNTLTHYLWLNECITSIKKTFYWKVGENLGITPIKDIFNDGNQLLSHLKLVNKYDIKTTFLVIITLHTCIPVDWLQHLRNC